MTAKPVTMVGLGVPFTLAASPDEVRKIMSERGMATAARERLAKQKAQKEASTATKGSQ